MPKTAAGRAAFAACDGVKLTSANGRGIRIGLYITEAVQSNSYVN